MVSQQEQECHYGWVVRSTGEHLAGDGDDVVDGQRSGLFHELPERPVALLHDQVVQS